MIAALARPSEMHVAPCLTTVVCAILVLSIAACQGSHLPPLTTVPHVDLQRFMGDWYVVANIPTFLEKDAYNALESYRLADDGTIETTFSFRAGSFGGKTKRYTPRGFVLDPTSNAIWGMRFFWPIKADYRIIYVAADYSRTVVAREKRDYVWIMARTPDIGSKDYESLIHLLSAQGYDISRIRKVPQQWGVPP